MADGTIVSKSYRGLQALKTLRRLRGLSRPEAAEVAGLSRSYFYRIETGQAELTAKSAKALARAYFVSPADIEAIMRRGILVSVEVIT